MIQGIYTFLLFPLMYLVFRILSLRDPKIKEGFKLRKNQAWIQNYQAGLRWIWFHVASGELEYAKPVIRELKKPGTLPADTRILVTYFSPSVLNSLKKTREIDLFVPMPWDTPWHWKKFLDHYKPLALAIARTDTWPNMIWETKKARVPSILFSATLPAHSGRYASFFGRLLYGRIVEDLTAVSCVSEEDKDHFLRLDPELKAEVDGDTRFDQVLARIQENRPVKSILDSTSPVLIAGSTWPEDENELLPALKKPVEKGLKVIIAPHEPTAIHLETLEKNLNQWGLTSARYSELETSKGAAVVIIDQVGILADLYRLAQIAFVGGSFKKSIHSVMEPAAAGCLTLMGPYHYNSREALALKKLQLAREVNGREDIEKALMKDLALSREDLLARKNHITDFVKRNQGVSFKVARWIGEKTQNA